MSGFATDCLSSAEVLGVRGVLEDRLGFIELGAALYQLLGTGFHLGRTCVSIRIDPAGPAFACGPDNVVGRANQVCYNVSKHLHRVIIILAVSFDKALDQLVSHPLRPLRCRPSIKCILAHEIGRILVCRGFRRVPQMDLPYDLLIKDD
ncbi:hypothetical protein KEU06_25240 [Pseudaminobacter sp. 19-2017]|uniref:Uncharacterized protein n=1 Tax=Pseudaminobacter soli (ex Zhang et al. 2022) TaxID=2831468 RepID=A0A942E1X4_9HYPH|nr:hypothetical protein [Pseudaminobacter soli]MBS3651916.1 hypothetical protein [Pseudaminobacter soli]